MNKQIQRINVTIRLHPETMSFIRSLFSGSNFQKSYTTQKIEDATGTCSTIQLGRDSKPASDVVKGEIEPEFLGITDAVRWSGIGRTSLFNLISSGLVRSINFRMPGHARGRRLIHLASLRQYLMSLKEGGETTLP